jgi:NTP pyrophosphatase (non-canonical NTP hydrolase)
LADSFDDLPIIEAMCRKYPLSGCAYCGKSVCKCEPSNRGQIQESDINRLQLNWSITQWRRHLRKIYGQANHENGIEFAVFRLQEELNEISEIEFITRFANDISVEEFREKISREFADAFAWIFGIANILDVELDGRAKVWAFKDCPDCETNPCNCGALKFFRELS